MLNLFRRHTRRCPHDSRESLRCQCPIWIDWTTDRQRIHKPLGLRDWQAAQRRARDIEADGLTTTQQRITVKTATEQFLKDTSNHVEKSTLKQYRILMQRLNEFCQQRGYVFLGQLGVVEVREFRQSWTVSPRTAQKHLGNLKRLFNWCVENQWLDKSPAKPLKTPNLDDSDVVPFTEEQIEKILEACGRYKGSKKPRLVLLTELMLATGLRIGDAVTIRRTRFIKTRDGWSVELRTAKTGTAVSCPIPNQLATEIIGLEELPFWTGHSDMEHAAANWRKIYSRVFKTAGIDGHPHQFRHTFAKRLLVRGVAIGHVASVLGHTVSVCQKHYSKWIPERQVAVDKAIRASWSGTRKAH